MKEKPILFSAPMVRAILSGQKTQTRRVVKNLTAYPDRWVWKINKGTTLTASVGETISSPYGKPGDRLWVRERFQYKAAHWIGECGDENEWLKIKYAADGYWIEIDDYPSDFTLPDRKGDMPSIHMPRWASRINLEITNVRVERLNDISNQDAYEEGAGECEEPNHDDCTFLTSVGNKCRFEHLWESINGEGSWKENPFVWVIEFKRVK